AAVSATTMAQPPRIPDGYIAGVVESENGPEAGVWVIAETTELKTPYIKIVVTDDEGRYVLPEMPDATYRVWVRGYGLVDSEPVEGRPGDHDLALRAVVAPTPQEAAKVYPGDYWLSLLELPEEDEFPGTGPSGNGISPSMQERGQWIHNLKSTCNFCHQLGNDITRRLDHMDPLGFRARGEEGVYRAQIGVRGAQMAGGFAAFGQERAAKFFADWTGLIEAGEVPPAPPRPQGIDRVVGITLWAWGVDHSFMHG